MGRDGSNAYPAKPKTDSGKSKKIYKTQIREVHLSMGKEKILFTEPKEFSEWVQQHTNIKDISEVDARVLLENFKDHDYILGTDKKENLIRVDTADVTSESEIYDIDDAIDIACEWNYEEILEAENDLSNAKDYQEYDKQDVRIKNLKSEEKHLDKLFDQTKYSIKIDELAAQMAKCIIDKVKNGKLSIDDLKLPSISGINEKVMSR